MPLMDIDRDTQNCGVANPVCGKCMATGQVGGGRSCIIVATKALIVKNQMKTTIFGNRDAKFTNTSFEEEDGSHLHNAISEKKLSVF
jgi:hypothetical protein